MSDKTIEVVISPQEWWPVYEVDESPNAYCSKYDKKIAIPVELLVRYKRFRDEFEKLNEIFRRIHSPYQGDPNG